jgi:Tol biopolymer transport system component
MRRVRIGIAGLMAVGILGCLHAPVLWSPDGRWLAYTLTVRPDRTPLEPGWLFATSPRPDRRLSELRLEVRGRELAVEAPRPAPGEEPAPPLYRLWATRRDTGESILLEESRGPLTSPSWSPDGQALAFGRLVPEPEGRAHFEVVVQEAPERQRVVLKQAAGAFPSRAVDLPGLAVAWSPDGRYLAVPWFQQTLSLGILRADNGRILKILEDAYLPAWSPDGTKLAFVQGGGAGGESLNYIDHHFGPAHHLADIGQTSQAPVWFRDSRSLAIAARTRRPSPFPHREIPSQQVEVLQVHVESGKTQSITTLTGDPNDREQSYNGSSFALSRDGDDLYHVSDVEGQPSQITWFHPRTLETPERFHPVDFLVRIGALALAPDGQTLALRVGSPGDLSPPALLDLTTRRFTPLVPDDTARLAWLAGLVQTAQVLLHTHLPSRDSQDRTIARPTLLPVPGELPINSEVAIRLRKLGKIGRPLCDRPAGAAGASPALLEVLAEARLFFDYLREDYTAALASLEALEVRQTTREKRLCLLGVRAQIFLGQQQFEQAGRTIEFLQAIDARPERGIEQSPAGAMLIGPAGPGPRWPGYLAERCRLLGKTAADAGPEFPPGHRNPDRLNFNLNPNADFVPGPGVAPLPFAPVAPMAPLPPEFVAHPPAPPR